MARRLEIFCVVCVLVMGLTDLSLAVQVQGYIIPPLKGEGWVHLHTINATWTEARLQCESEGGILTSPTTHWARTAMTDAMIFNDLETLYTGYYANTAKGDFVSIDGIPLTNSPAPWAKGEPNGWGDDDNCLALSRAGELADVSCSSARPYLCFKSDAAMQDSVCGTSAGYTFEPRTGSCYKFYSNGVPWYRAAMKCASDRANLAVINSNEESRVLKDLFALNPASTITGDYNHVAHIGIIDWTSNGNWLIFFGQIFILGIEHCGSISRDGKFNFSPCFHNNMPYICEIIPL